MSTGEGCACLFPPDVDAGAWVNGRCPVHMRDWSGEVHEISASEVGSPRGTAIEHG